MENLLDFAAQAFEFVFMCAFFILLSPKSRSLKLKVALLKVALIAIIMAITVSLPWTRYHWATLLDTIPAYEEYINGKSAELNSAGDIKLARERIHYLKDDPVWQTAQYSGDIHKINDYLKEYPSGKHTDEATSQRIDFADAEWDQTMNSRSETAIRQFINNYQNTPHIKDAEKLINKLYNDFTWVNEQDTIEPYRQFLEYNPKTPNRSYITKKIIDLEVASIAVGVHDSLPKSQSISTNPMAANADITVHNETSYQLTIRYSGPDSKKIIVPSYASKRFTLVVGSYTVAASLYAANVRDYVGTEMMRGGSYEVEYYIQ